MGAKVSAKKQSLLVKSAKAGDREAISLLIQGCHRELFKYCASLTGDPAVGEDLCQECEIKAIRSLHLFEAPYKFLPWEKAIARNLFLTTVSETKKHPTESLSEEDLEQVVTDLNFEDQFTFQEILETLKDSDRKILILTLVYGYNYQETGNILQIPSNLVGVKLHRLKKIFQSHSKS